MISYPGNVGLDIMYKELLRISFSLIFVLCFVKFYVIDTHAETFVGKITRFLRLVLLKLEKERGEIAECFCSGYSLFIILSTFMNF